MPGYLGICGQLKENNKTEFYGIGANAEDCEMLPAGFEELTIPAYTWVIFKSVRKNSKAIQRTWDRIYSEWMPTTKYTVIPDYCIENYLPGDENSDHYISELWLPVKKVSYAKKVPVTFYTIVLGKIGKGEKTIR